MKRPSLERLVAHSQIISSVAIIVSLFYAGFEYRRANTLTNREVEDTLFQGVREMERLLIENQDMAEIALKASDQPEELLPAERLRYLAYDHIFYDNWESAWNYYNQGILEAENWESWNGWFKMEFLKNSWPMWILWTPRNGSS